jgi:hypothetical protein
MIATLKIAMCGAQARFQLGQDAGSALWAIVDTLLPRAQPHRRVEM